MKISRVRTNIVDDGSKLTVNAKTAIVSENCCQEGILYNDPAHRRNSRKSDSERDSYIDSRLKSARRLYHVFNEDKSQDNDLTDEDLKVKEAINEIIKAFNSRNGICLSEILKDNERYFEKYAEESYRFRKECRLESPSFEECGLDFSASESSELKRIISENNYIDRIRTCTIKYDVTITEHVIDTVIARNLKKSLSKEKVKKALKKLLMKTYGLPYSDKEADVQRDFIDYVIEDYYHVRTKSQVSKAIKNNNMVVQPDEGTFNLSGVKSQNDNKRSAEKEAFRKFLSEYANLDQDIRDDMLRRLRRLVVLYFYGADDVLLSDQNEKFDVWADHAKRRGNSQAYINVPPAKMKADGKKDKNAERVRKSIAVDLYRRKNIECYRESIKQVEENNNGRYFDDMMLNMFFIHRIEHGVERIYASLRNLDEFKAQIGYLSEKVWKDLINYMSVKYIAIGKAVYNYAMDELNDSDKKEIEFGKINEAYISGISSFDYELIKAEEMLQRENAIYVAFAARHLSSQTVELDEKNSDFLTLKNKKTMSKEKDKPADANIMNFIKDKNGVRDTVLQYFGGKSMWVDFDFSKYYDGEYDDVDFLTDLKEIVYSMRNDSFHYATENHNTGNWNMELIGGMFEYESKRLVGIQKDKFYSNNLPMFYKTDDLKKALVELYKGNVERASQVPSYNKVFVRKNFPEIVRDKECFGIELGLPADADREEDELKFYNALYYLFKEIYYNSFLNDSGVRERFIKMSTKTADRYSRDKEKEYRDKSRNGSPEEKKVYKEKLQNYIAQNDFGQRVKSIVKTNPEYSLAQICQLIMTEYNQQNTGCMRKKSAVSKERNKDSYQHYKVLLLLNLRKSFVEYVKEHFSFVLKPNKHDLGEKENFIPDFTNCVSPYSELVNKVRKSAELQKWYIVSRLLSPTQANHLLGSLHSYKQYVWDVYRRAEETGAKIKRRVSDQKIADVDIQDIDAVLDLSVKLSGTVSIYISDYFKSEEEYAEYIGSYLDFEYSGAGYRESLMDFCDSEVIKNQKVELYYDAKNPKPNRNIVLSKLYGERKLLEKITERVTRKDITDYYKLQKDIKQYQTKGIYDSEEEQKNIKKFQELKNIVEFRNLMDYSEIADELQGQLINWIYLRERDLMYFQLGYHYMCLNNDSNKPGNYVTLNYKDSKKINGAILYHICALYINGLPLYYINKADGKWTKSSGRESTGAKIGEFYAYAGSFENNCDCYAAGIELFENINEHDNITELRNYVEHFRYYVSMDRSFLDLYSEVYDRFFTYDMKYRKNVPIILYNILLGHFVNVRLVFTSSKKVTGKKGDKAAKEKECASITVRAINGIKSEQFTYKLKNGDKVQIDSRNIRYLQTVAKLLYCPENVNVTEMVEVNNNNTAKGRNNESKRNKEQEKKEYEKYHEKKKKESRFLGGMAGNIDWDAINAKLKN